MMAKRKPSDTLTLLFIGNSFTQRNNVPKLVADLAAAHGTLLSMNSSARAVLR